MSNKMLGYSAFLHGRSITQPYAIAFTVKVYRENVVELYVIRNDGNSIENRIKLGLY